MFLTVDANDKRPLYQQIVDGVKALIAGGTLREGMTLPSVRQVAGDLGVNLNTIAVAYRQLQEEGFLAVRHGAGAVVASRRARYRKTLISGLPSSYSIRSRNAIFTVSPAGVRGAGGVAIGNSAQPAARTRYVHLHAETHPRQRLRHMSIPGRRWQDASNRTHPANTYSAASPVSSVRSLSPITRN